jgi:ABC-2 type transport system permease protein
MTGAVPFRALVGSEWAKLRSLRSTWWCLAVYVDVAAGAGWLAAGTTHTAGAAGAAMSAVLIGFGFAQPALLVLGVLAMSAEFGSGMALASFTAVPRRTRVLVAKSVVVAAVCALPSAVAGLLCALAARTLVAVPGGVPLGTTAVLRPLAVQVVAATLVGLLGLALGTLLRSTAGAVGAGLALILVLPPALALTAGHVGSRISQALPALRVGEEAFFTVPTGWGAGLLVAVAWVVAAWAGAATLLERRDV